MSTRPLLYAAAGVVLLAGCGIGTDAGIEMRSTGTSTTFVTLPPPTTTLPPSTTQPRVTEPGSAQDDEEDADPLDGLPVDAATGFRVYTIQGGDILVRIATRFGITLDELVEANGWGNANQRIDPGDEILIPVADEETPEGGATTATTATTDDENETCTYTIRSGDLPGKVAAAHGISVGELNTLNAGTPFYSGFVVGIEIVVPCS